MVVVVVVYQVYSKFPAPKFSIPFQLRLVSTDSELSKGSRGGCVYSVDTQLPHAPPTTPSVFDGQFLLGCQLVPPKVETTSVRWGFDAVELTSKYTGAVLCPISDTATVSGFIWLFNKRKPSAQLLITAPLCIIKFTVAEFIAKSRYNHGKLVNIGRQR